MRLTAIGSGAARGMALGRARLEQPSRYLVDARPLEDAEVAPELERLDHAIARALDELAELRERLRSGPAGEAADFIDAHRLLLLDQDLNADLHALVRDGRHRAGAALNLQRDRLVAVFEAMDDPYLRSRKEDIDHVIGRVHAALLRSASAEERKLASRVGEILVADTVAPAELVPLAEHGVLGVVLASGSIYSHSAILARSLRLPMVVGAHDAFTRIRDGDLVLIDGDSGEVVVHPTAQDLARYRSAQRELARHGKRLAQLRDAETRTVDGKEIFLYANAEMPAAIAQARAAGAAGIGLYRTEFLFLQRKELPGEEEQFLAYRDVVLGMGGLPVTIRTLDLGADKADSSGLVLDEEPNPALGVRGIRLSLVHPDLLATQLRAIVRASGYGPVRVLVPMVSGIDEIRQVRELLHSCARDLRSAGHEIAETVDLGAMIEVPAAAIALPSMIGDLDFVAIGTNDLVQYTLAVDRNNDALGHLYDPLHPAVLRLIARTIAVATRAGKRVSLCGEIAGDTRFTALLLALGLTDFSMHPAAVLELRAKVNSLDRGKLRRQAPGLLRASLRADLEHALAQLEPEASSQAGNEEPGDAPE